MTANGTYFDPKALLLVAGLLELAISEHFLTKFLTFFKNVVIFSRLNLASPHLITI